MGVNVGDRRAVFYLISAIKPTTVLEVGTHIGASTIHIASALATNSDNDVSLTSVDIKDVNSQVEKPWLNFGTTNSPAEMVEKLGHESFVNFYTDTSLKFLGQCQKKFDFIFLDGDHSAKTVYSEIPLALSLLNENGVILLHDYFPENKPLWSNNELILGPYLAGERLKNEGSDITIIPLGSLPWPTKLGSNTTSLALLVRTNSTSDH